MKVIDKVQFNIRPCGFKPSFYRGGGGGGGDLGGSLKTL